MLLILQSPQLKIMGKASNGMFGAFTGKIGNLVGYYANGNYIIRSIPSKRTRKVSTAEKSNRQKFAIVQAWLKPILDFVRVGFKNYGTSTGGYKAAVADALRNAVKGAYPSQYVDPEFVKVSGGDLHFPVAVSMTLLANHVLQFTWSTENEDDDPYDQAMLLAYGHDQDKAVFKETAAFRWLGTDNLVLKPGPVETAYHIYLAFVAQDRSRQSKSRYLGVVTV